jgi:hypothetical protein
MPSPQAMPTAGLDRGPRTAQPHAVPPPVSPPQIHPRAEPTPINGYPAAHARTPSPADTGPVSPAAPPAPGVPAAPAGAGGPPSGPASPPPQSHAAPDGAGLPHAGAGHAGPAARVTPTFEMPRAGRAHPDVGEARLDAPQAGRGAQTAPPRPTSTDPPSRAGFASAPTAPPPRPGQAAPARPGQAAPARPGQAPPARPAPQQPSGGAQHRTADAVPAQREPVEHDPAPTVRLTAAAPDAEPRYADADLAPNWFATKPRPAAAPATGGTQPPGPRDADDSAATGREPAPPRHNASNVVLDLDLTGLLNGMTGEQAMMAAETDGQPRADQNPPRQQAPQAPQGPQADGAQQWSVPDFASVIPGQTATPKPPAHPLRPLSAEDLEAIRWRLDGGTLREVVDDRDALREIAERLDEPLADEEDNAARAGLLSVRAEVYRLLGELGLAAAASRLALAHAEAAQDVRATVIAQAELAHVLRLRGDFAEADRLFEQAAGSEAPELLRSVVHENAGRSCFDQGRLMEALDHFARAIRLGDPEDTDLAARIAVCLEAVYIHVLRDGWGPYPRLRREILGVPDRSGAPAG